MFGKPMTWIREKLVSGWALGNEVIKGAPLWSHEYGKAWGLIMTSGKVGKTFLFVFEYCRNKDIMLFVGVSLTPRTGYGLFRLLAM
jgi:hypothetical protein